MNTDITSKNFAADSSTESKRVLVLALPYVISFGLLLLVFLFVLHGYRFNWHSPLLYDGDGVFGLLFPKTIIDTGWYLTNPYLAYPGIFQLYDYPMLDNFNFALQWLIAHLTHSPFAAVNLFYALTYVTAAFTALYAYKKIGLNNFFAIVASVLFAFLPYHFARGEMHLFLSSYFAVPLWLMLAFAIINNEHFYFFKNKFLNNLILFSLLFVCVNSGLYYTFFGLFYIFLAGIIAAINSHSMQPFMRSIKIISLCLLIALINISGYLHFLYQHGINTGVGARLPNEAQLYSTNLTQMLMPIEHHRLIFLAQLREKYDLAFGVPNLSETPTSVMGIIGSLGMIFSLLLVLFARAIKTGKNIYHAALFNLAGILLATFGGLGALFAFLISPQIRCYARIAPFLGFLSLFVFFKAVQFICKKYQLQQVTIVFVAAALLFFGILDQISPVNAFTKTSPFANEVYNDQVFIGEIEKVLPAGSAIFQIPYIGFPESPPINKMQNYELFRPYLVSNKNFHWSFGAIKGRPAAIWQEKVSNMPAAEMLKTIVLAGFEGIYIDRNGYADNGKAVESSLTILLKEQPLVSPNQQFSFFSLVSYKAALKQQYGSNWEQALTQAREPFFGKI